MKLNIFFRGNYIIVRGISASPVCHVLNYIMIYSHEMVGASDFLYVL